MLCQFPFFPDLRKSWPLVISPTFGAMFGGQLVSVSGPCFSPTDNIVCRFSRGNLNATVPGYSWGNPMQAVCVQPTLHRVGQVFLAVSTDGGKSYFRMSAFYTVREYYCRVYYDAPSTDRRNGHIVNAIIIYCCYNILL